MVGDGFVNILVTDTRRIASMVVWFLDLQKSTWTKLQFDKYQSILDTSLTLTPILDFWYYRMAAVLKYFMCDEFMEIAQGDW